MCLGASSKDGSDVFLRFSYMTHIPMADTCSGPLAFLCNVFLTKIIKDAQPIPHKVPFVEWKNAAGSNCNWLLARVQVPFHRRSN